MGQIPLILERKQKIDFLNELLRSTTPLSSNPHPPRNPMFNTLIWNIRGTGIQDKINYLNFEVRQSNIQILDLLEPKHSGAVIYHFAVNIGFPNYWHGNPINSHI